MNGCQYKFRSGDCCPEEPVSGSSFCILHTPFPENRESEEFAKLKNLKEQKVREKAEKQDFNFEGAKLFSADFSGMSINGDLTFTDASVLNDVGVRESEIRGHARFEGAKIEGYVSFDGAKIVEDMNFEEVFIKRSLQFGETSIGDSVFFQKARIDESIHFEKTKILEKAFFGEAKIGANAWFKEVEIGGEIHFNKTFIGNRAEFEKANIKGYIWFDGVIIEKDASFKKARLEKSIYFKNSRIEEGINFEGAKIDEDINFSGSVINGDAFFNRARILGNILIDDLAIKGILDFSKTKFKKMLSQEKACRKARRVCEDTGDREGSDYYFYHEMKARRKQKNWFVRFLELPIQYVFGYGTKWEWVLLTWSFVTFGFGFFYWFTNGIKGANSLLENIFFSISTVTTMGFGYYRPLDGLYQVLTSFQAIFGAFIWAAFIAIFARKYMR